MHMTPRERQYWVDQLDAAGPEDSLTLLALGDWLEERGLEGMRKGCRTADRPHRAPRASYLFRGTGPIDKTVTITGQWMWYSYHMKEAADSRWPELRNYEEELKADGNVSLWKTYESYGQAMMEYLEAVGRIAEKANVEAK